MEEKKVPALRFRGFDNAWEQCKVNSLFEPLTERNDDLLPYSKTLSVATMTYKEVGNGAADSSLANYKRLRLGDVAFEGHTSKEFRYGRFVLNDAGDGIMSPRFSALRPISELPVQFWKYYIHYEPIMKRSLVNCTKAGTMMNELVVPEFLQESLLVPSTDEQVQIGKYFANLNHLIILHQRKLEMLKKVKKSMLEKMFPKNDAKVPEVRFSDFTDAWEQHKVREVADRYDNLRIPVAANLRISGSTPYYGANGIQDYVDGYTHEGEFVLVAEDGANDLKNYPVKCVKGRIWVNNHAHVLQSKNEIADNKFLAFAISQADIEALLVGGGRAKLNAETLMEINMLLPKKQEQVSIGNYFTNLDHLISLHQRKLEKLKNIKKSMLEKMFII